MYQRSVSTPSIKMGSVAIQITSAPSSSDANLENSEMPRFTNLIDSSGWALNPECCYVKLHHNVRLNRRYRFSG